MVALCDSHKYKCNIGSDATIKTGQVCIVFDASCPRAFWRLARVKELITGKDGNVRGAVVKTVTKTGGVSVLRRPLQLLYPLEFNEDKDAQSNETEEESPPTTTVPERPIRAAARLARERLKILSEELL